MGYDLHITRKMHWADSEGPTIFPGEWLAVVDSDTELSRSVNSLVDTAVPVVQWRGVDMFHYDSGEVSCKNPDVAVVRKMVALAGRLNATVQGDDGEIYGADGAPRSADAPLPPPADARLEERIIRWSRLRKGGRWRFALLYGALGWGVPFAILWSAAFAWAVGDRFLSVLALAAPLAPIGGIFFGLYLWRTSEAWYAKMLAERDGGITPSSPG